MEGRKTIESPVVTNPFEGGAEQRTRELLHKLEEELAAAWQTFQDADLPVEVSRGGTEMFETSSPDGTGQATIDRSKNGRIWVEDIQRKGEAMNCLSCEISGVDRTDNRPREGYVQYKVTDATRAKRRMGMRFHLGKDGHPVHIVSVSIDGDEHEIESLGPEGLPVGGGERLEWDLAWRDFQNGLFKHSRFRDFVRGQVDRDGYQAQGDEERWWRDLLGRRLVVEDAAVFLDQLENMWNVAESKAVLPKKFPRDTAPQLGEKQPPKPVISHANLQAWMKRILSRLGEVVKRVEAASAPPPSPHPYR